MNYIDKDLILYHSADLDGHGSAAVVASISTNPFILKGYNYENNLQTLVYEHYNTIVCVDLNLKKEHRDYLSNHSDYLIYIDHHYHEALKDVETQFYTDDDRVEIINRKFSAIALTYAFFHDVSLISEYDELPPIVRYIEQYDRWSISKPVLYMQYYLRSLNLDIQTIDGYDRWIRLLDLRDKNRIDEMLDKGYHIKEYNDNYIRPKALKSSFIIKREGLKFRMVNSFQHSSQIVFENEFDTDILSIFHFNGKDYLVSFYTTKANINVAKLAEKYGGGGHQKASGCRMTIDQFLDFINRRSYD